MSQNSSLISVVKVAQQDRKLAKMLRKIAKFDTKLMPTSGTAIRIADEFQRTQSPKWQRMMQKASTLCDEAAIKIAGPDDDIDEIALWISHNCQEIVRELNKRKR